MHRKGAPFFQHKPSPLPLTVVTRNRTNALRVMPPFVLALEKFTFYYPFSFLEPCFLEAFDSPNCMKSCIVGTHRKFIKYCQIYKRRLFFLVGEQSTSSRLSLARFAGYRVVLKGLFCGHYNIALPWRLLASKKCFQLVVRNIFAAAAGD